MKRILIFGETPLVQEYALLCLRKKLGVHVRLNAGAKTGAIPKGVKKVKKPGKSFDIAIELTNTSIETKKKNLSELDKGLGSKTPILSSSITTTLAEQTTWLTKPERLVGIGALPTLLQGSLVELTHAPSTDPKNLTSAQVFLGKLGKEYAIVQDSAGMVLPRILCMLANEAFFGLMERVASGAEIDTAMKLGTNYPKGPVEWAEEIGFRQVHAVIEALYRTFGEDRYRAAPLLQQAAFLGSLPPRQM